MPNAAPIQPAFVSGEISPLVEDRVDVNRRFLGANQIENFYVMTQGALMRRSGTTYIDELPDFGILVDFIFSQNDAHQLVFTPNLISIYKEATLVTTLATTYAIDELRDLRYAQSADVLWITHPDHPPAKVSRTGTTWSIDDETYVDGPHLDFDERDITMTLSAVTNRATIKSTASDFVVGDVGKFVEYVRNGVTRIGDIKTFVSATEVTIDPFENIVDPATIDGKASLSFAAASGAMLDRIRSNIAVWNVETENSYLKVGSTWYFLTTHYPDFEAVAAVPPGAAWSADVIAAPVQPTMVTTAGTITFSDQLITATVTASDDVFDATRDVNRQLRLDFAGQKVWSKITAVASATSATLELGVMPPSDPTNPTAFVDGGKSLLWQLGAFYVNNYPEVVGFHEGRLVYFATPLEPQTLWLSKSDDYNNFGTTDRDSVVLDNSSIRLTLDSGEINRGVWLSSSRVLIAGTEGGVWQIKSESVTQALTPTNITARKHVHVPCKRMPAIQSGDAILYVQQGGDIIQEAIYDFAGKDGWVANKILSISEHILRDGGGAIDGAYQREPEHRLWYVTAKGGIVCCTYDPSEGVQVVAWYRHVFTNGFVESVEVVPTSTGKDRVYFVVRRVINGVTKWFLECLEDDYWPVQTANADMVFVDSAKKITLSPAGNVATGYGHLEGETVVPLVDGSVRPDVVVSGGSFTFGGAAGETVVAGLKMESKYLSVPIEGGEGVNKQNRFNGVIVRLINSLGLNYGQDVASRSKSFRRTDDPMDAPPSIFDGVKELTIGGTFSRTSRIALSQDQPYPLTILSVSPQGITARK